MALKNDFANAILEFFLIVLFILISIIFLYSWPFSFYIDPCLLCDLIPIKFYPNAEADKAKILKENRKKSGVYM
jgi:hypothetical protein